MLTLKNGKVVKVSEKVVRARAIRENQIAAGEKTESAFGRALEIWAELKKTERATELKNSNDRSATWNSEMRLALKFQDAISATCRIILYAASRTFIAAARKAAKKAGDISAVCKADFFGRLARGEFATAADLTGEFAVEKNDSEKRENRLKMLQNSLSGMAKAGELHLAKEVISAVFENAEIDVETESVEQEWKDCGQKAVDLFREAKEKGELSAVLEVAGIEAAKIAGRSNAPAQTVAIGG